MFVIAYRKFYLFTYKLRQYLSEFQNGVRLNKTQKTTERLRDLYANDHKWEHISPTTQM